jgi:hypothetical protein
LNIGGNIVLGEGAPDQYFSSRNPYFVARLSGGNDVNVASGFVEMGFDKLLHGGDSGDIRDSSGRIVVTKAGFYFADLNLTADFLNSTSNTRTALRARLRKSTDQGASFSVVQPHLLDLQADLHQHLFR